MPVNEPSAPQHSIKPTTESPSSVNALKAKVDINDRDSHEDKPPISQPAANPPSSPNPDSSKNQNGETEAEVCSTPPHSVFATLSEF